MPRPISWLPRLHEIRKSVSTSVRSHYERKDLEGLFQLQPRAAQLLLEILPSTSIGRSRLVERQALAQFLDRMHGAEDPSFELEQVRQKRPESSRRRIRTLVQRDVEVATLDTLPANLKLSQGRIEATFHTVEELAATMLALAQVMEGEPVELARLIEVRAFAPEDVEADAGVQRMFQSLRQEEAARR
ncbi:hypothetical protein SAMN05421770_106210 [Granulicella rosea]|uniref:Uncharacterized protein n=1 Tax=Granulicella rosea TaxID=474952 RepID=A0A239L8S3_9BACT|nr:hypothetical protein SAMN05421770_106210 [Granulicella rosea]